MPFLNQMQLSNWITPERIALLIRFALILCIGFPLIKLLKKIIMKFLSKYLNPQSEMIAQRFVWYTLLIILVVTALNQLGFKLSALLGAAGIFGVAIGFASQTSFSNLISGMFMISEKSFSVGDTIQVGATTGEVLSIDLLSVKLRTFDNRFIRIPNENLIKTELINISRFPIRRTDLLIGISYNTDVRFALQVLKNIVKKNQYSLHEPSPSFSVQDFTDSVINIKIGVWTLNNNFAECTNSIRLEILDAFQNEQIEIPFPQRAFAFTDKTNIPNIKDERS